MVSRGNSPASTEIPAIPPAFKFEQHTFNKYLCMHLE
jgi:hypothetical protein